MLDVSACSRMASSPLRNNRLLLCGLVLLATLIGSGLCGPADCSPLEQWDGHNCVPCHDGECGYDVSLPGCNGSTIILCDITYIQPLNHSVGVHVNCSSRGLSAVPCFLPESIKELLMNNNPMRPTVDYPFHYLRMLTFLDLSYCDINNFGSNFRVSTICQLLMRGNNIDCCSLSWLSQISTDRSPYQNQSFVACSSPVKITGCNGVQLRGQISVCNDLSKIAEICIICGLVLLYFIIVAITYRAGVGQENIECNDEWNDREYVPHLDPTTGVKYFTIEGNQSRFDRICTPFIMVILRLVLAGSLVWAYLAGCIFLPITMIVAGVYAKFQGVCLAQQQIPVLIISTGAIVLTLPHILLRLWTYLKQQTAGKQNSRFLYIGLCCAAPFFGWMTYSTVVIAQCDHCDQSTCDAPCNPRLFLFARAATIMNWILPVFLVVTLQVTERVLGKYYRNIWRRVLKDRKLREPTYTNELL
eukprot:m.176783 g.176783  ORF g.176783 m.176783 type:complete len:473 (+) comp17370_c2_seq1:307-1725(+)